MRRAFTEQQPVSPGGLFLKGGFMLLSSSASMFLLGAMWEPVQVGLAAASAALLMEAPETPVAIWS